MICSAQEQSLRTNYTKYHVDKTVELPLCRLCGVRGGSVSHNVSECTKLDQRLCKRRHKNVARYAHWIVCGDVSLELADTRYNHKSYGVIENEEYKILWDMDIQCDQKIQEKKPDIILLNKKSKEIKIIDITFLGDSRVKDKENKKIERYQLLKDELISLCGLKKAVAILVVVGALDCLSKHFREHLDKGASNIRTEVIQTTMLLDTARILRKVLSL